MAVTINYLWPQQGSQPTAATMQNFNMLIASVVATTTADTSAAITHSFGLATSDITQGMPTVVLTPQGDPTTGAWYLSSQATNFAILQKNTTSAGPQTVVTITRPNSLVR